MFQEPGGEAVVVVPLLDGVVAGREGKVFLAVDNQKALEFRIGLPGKLLSALALPLWLLGGGSSVLLL